MFITIQILNLDLNKYCRCGRQYGLVDLSADWTADVEGDNQSRHRAPPQHHLWGLQGANGIVGKTHRAKRWGLLRTGAKTASRRGPGVGTKPRTEGRHQGRALGGLPLLHKDGAELGRNSQKRFKPGSWAIGGETKAKEGGRPHRGGCWGPKTGLRTGLSQSMETVSCLKPISKEKNLSWQLRTL